MSARRVGGRLQGLLLASVASLLLSAGVSGAAEPTDAIADARKEVLALYGGGSTEIVAKALGVEQLDGKAFDTGSNADGPSKAGIAAAASSSSDSSAPPWDPYCCTDRAPRSENNSSIRWFPGVSENEPTVVANPRDPRKLVAGTHFIGDTANRCVAHYSRDGGRTWNPVPIHMPQLAHGTECSDPVLAYAPDGSRVYYAYLDLSFPTTFTVLVSYSDDDGKTWKGPIVALQRAAADYDKPWIGTHVPVGDDDDQKNEHWVYVSATRFEFSSAASPDCTIDFTRSSDKGLTWSPAQSLDAGNCSSPGGIVVPQGSRPQGGLGKDVIVAWYNSGADGFRTGTFEIRTRYSSDNGATFGPIVTAAVDQFELQLFLGPAIAYHRWWGGMFPDVEIAENGSAHILYTHDPQAGSTVEDGDIRYIGSTGPPYAAWSAPSTVNDDASGKAQGWATLEATSDRRRTTLYAIWEDHRTSAQDNMFYDVFWAKRTGSPIAASGSWTPNRKLTDAQSTSDFLFLGDYYDLALARGDDDDHDESPFVYGVWTDRRDEPTEFDFDDDIWGAQLRVDDDDESDDD